jgi:Uma2 family endonuclease
VVPSDLVDPVRKLPTIEDLERLPPGVKGEIIEGVLYTQPRLRIEHHCGGGNIFGDLLGPFGRDSGGGPGGWWIFAEPGIELPNTPEISPDVAGYRRERLPALPGGEPLRLVPDWVCELFSPAESRHDILVKKPYYAKIGVQHHWMVDVAARVVLAYRLEKGHWVELGTWGDETDARIEPFDAVPLDVRGWWPVSA